MTVNTKPSLKVLSRALTSILTKYQYTYQVSVYWYLYLVFRFPNTDTDTSYFKNVLEYWYFQYFSVSVFLKNEDKIITWYMIIPKNKSNYTPLLMAVIVGHFQICNSILLGCFKWPFITWQSLSWANLIRKALLLTMHRGGIYQFFVHFFLYKTVYFYTNIYAYLKPDLKNLTARHSESVEKSTKSWKL